MGIHYLTTAKTQEEEDADERVKVREHNTKVRALQMETALVALNAAKAAVVAVDPLATAATATTVVTAVTAATVATAAAFIPTTPIVCGIEGCEKTYKHDGASLKKHRAIVHKEHMRLTSAAVKIAVGIPNPVAGTSAAPVDNLNPLAGTSMENGVPDPVSEMEENDDDE